MLSLYKSRVKYISLLKEELKKITRRLSNFPEVEKIILFGSYLEGRRDLLTDLDILVVMETNEDFLTRMKRIYQALDSKVDIDVLVYTPGELERLKDRGFIKKVLREGEIIYERKS